MRVSRAVLAFFALPLTLGAQQAASNPITAVMKQRTMTFQQRLAQAFDSIPEGIFGYKPTPAQMTIGDIAQHLADDNYFYCNQFGAMKGTRAAEETATPDTVKAKWPKDKLVTQMKTSFKFCEDALAQLDDAKLGDQITQTLSNGQSRTVTRAGPVMGHIIDMADHYSQLANYMRLNNMLPPTALPRPRPPGGGQ
ncbi:MAG TPA: DinB family protein [Gemmatimonadaceae bacterium]|nr:DinB family protein [Gemmatimonadaceae bacterium]